MSRFIVASTIFATVLCATPGRAADSPAIAPGARLEKLAGDFKFTEGPHLRMRSLGWSVKKTLPSASAAHLG
jgi:hypothetical protein